ncbi:MAG: hypothetical protein U9P80_00315, partial [Thermodesulfobacteriota bacterium]|nr:hypothetical protein [Thermodesulfobacteriota bacterium]
MKKINTLILMLIVVFGLVLGGCDKRKDEDRDNPASLNFEGLNSEELIAEGHYPNLSNMIGHMNADDLLVELQGIVDTLNALAVSGDATTADYETTLAIMKNVYNMMKAEQAAGPGAEGAVVSEASDAMIELAAMIAQDNAQGKNIGMLLNQILDQTGRDVLTENIYPILEYTILNMEEDDDLLGDVMDGITINDIEEEQFDDLMAIANSAVDSSGDYAAIYNHLDDTLDAVKESDLDLSVGDLRDTLDYLSGSDDEETADGPQIDSEVMSDVLNAAADFLETDQAKDDLKAILTSSGGLLQDDTQGILEGLSALLSMNYNDTLEPFVENALYGLAPTSDGDTMAAILSIVADIDPADIEGL